MTAETPPLQSWAAMLHEAIRNGHTTIVEVLLSAGVPLGTDDDSVSASLGVPIWKETTVVLILGLTETLSVRDITPRRHSARSF